MRDLPRLDLPHLDFPRLDLPGAVADTGLDAGVAAHYGDPMGEQRAWQRGTGFADLSHLGVVRMAGPDRLGLLHALTSAKLDDLAPGQSRETLQLDPSGHIEFAMGVVDDGQATWLITDAGSGAGLAAWLNSMRFAKRVEIADVSDQWAALGTPGTSLAAGVGAGLELDTGTGSAPGVGAGLPPDIAPGQDTWPVWRDPWPGVVPGGTSYAPLSGHPGEGWHLSVTLVPRGQLAAVAGALRERGAQPVGMWALEALRIAAWRPRAGREVGGAALPHELDWLRTAVHLDKGCYRGQETVAKVINVGLPPRRLTLLHLDGSGHTLPPVGAAVMVAGTSIDTHADQPQADQPQANQPQANQWTQVGQLTSVSRHYEDGPIGLALLRRALDPAAALEVDGIAAAQQVVVPPSGLSAARPHIERPRDLGFATRGHRRSLT